MSRQILHYISPNFTHEKLASRDYSDLVDIFEDRMRCWVLDPATHLMQLKHGDVPAVAQTLGYFEGIEIYCSGQDSKGASKEFFRRGFQRVFSTKPESTHLFDKMIGALYVEARCGFAHDGLFRNRVFFSEAKPEALTVTWPRKDGQFVADGNMESVVVNAPRFIDGVRKHFDRYVAVLRGKNDEVASANFLAAVNLKWGLDEPDRAIGCTENEFFGTS